MLAAVQNKAKDAGGDRGGGWLERVPGSRYVFRVAHRIPS